MKVQENIMSKLVATGVGARRTLLVGGAAIASAMSPPSVIAAGDPIQGAAVFRNCLACHSIEPGQNLTGPTLNGVIGRKAGSLASFHRYSDALKRSKIVWNAESLDAWIRNPAALVPGNEMGFPGIPNAATRSDLIAYLEAASGGTGSSAALQTGTNMGGALPDLKEAKAVAQVKSINYCADTYIVSTGAGRTLKFWEFNLRFKSDSSARGPRKGEPVLVGQGMQGDRAQVVFSSPAEISPFIKRECP